MSDSKERKYSEIRLGEFIASLDVLPFSKLKAALKISRDFGLPLGRTLVVRGLLTNEELSTLLELHSIFKRGTVEFHHIVDAYGMSRRRGWQVREALSALGCAVDELETVRLGQLLVDAELVDEPDLEEALSLQRLCGLPLGRVLSIDARVDERIVGHALSYQNSIRNEGMRYESAVDKLKMLPFLIQTDSLKPVIKLNLRELLIGGRICDESDLRPAVNFADANNLPLEKVLYGYDWLDPRLVSATVALSRLVDRGYISAQDAMEFLTGALSEDRIRRLDAVSAKSPELRLIEGDLNLYKFLIAAGFLNPDRIRNLTKEMVNREYDFGQLIGRTLDRTSSKNDLKAAVFECFATDAMLAPVLIKLGGVPEPLVEHAQNLVNLVNFGGASLEQCLLSFAWSRKELGNL